MSMPMPPSMQPGGGGAPPSPGGMPGGPPGGAPGGGPDPMAMALMMQNLKKRGGKKHKKGRKGRHAKKK